MAPALPFVGTRPPQPGPDEREAQDKHRLSAQAMERSRKATFVGGVISCKGESQEKHRLAAPSVVRSSGGADFFAETSPKSQQKSQQTKPNSTGHMDRRGTVGGFVCWAFSEITAGDSSTKS